MRIESSTVQRLKRFCGSLLTNTVIERILFMKSCKMLKMLELQEYNFIWRKKNWLLNMMDVPSMKKTLKAYAVLQTVQRKMEPESDILE